MDGIASYFLWFGRLTEQRCAGREHWTINASVKISSEPQFDISSRLREAWKRMRFLHPNLATTADLPTFTRTYTVPDQRTIEKWLDESVCTLDIDDVQSVWALESGQFVKSVLGTEFK